jgi:hypothetical protein
VPKTVEIIRRVHVEKLLDASNGRFLTVLFTKLDKTERTMNGRFGVSKGVKGTAKKPTAHSGNPYKTLYEAPTDNFRHINLETISEIRMGGKVYKVEG